MKTAFKAIALPLPLGVALYFRLVSPTDLMIAARVLFFAALGGGMALAIHGMTEDRDEFVTGERPPQHPSLDKPRLRREHFRKRPTAEQAPVEHDATVATGQ